MRSIPALAGLPALVAAVLAAGACADLVPAGSDDEPAELDHRALSPVGLAAGAAFGEELLGLPGRMRIIDDVIVVVDLASDSMIHVLAKSDGRAVRSFGRSGEGPGEYRYPWSIDRAPGEPRAFWIYDAGLRRSTYVHLDRDLEPDALPGRRSININVDATVLDPVWLGEEMVALGFFQSGRLAFIDAAGEGVRFAGSTPRGDPTVPPTVRQHAYQSVLAASPDRSRLAVATRHLNRLEIYRADGTLEYAGDGPFRFAPDLVVRERGGNPTLATDESLRFGFIDVVATEHHIYGLFSGRTRRGFPGEANFGEYVHLYDWSGDLVGVYRLAAAAISIDVEPDGSALYAVRHHPTPAVVRYDLPDQM